MSITVNELEVTARISELLSYVKLGEAVVIADASVPRSAKPYYNPH
ncbi:MAG: hypothetical protein HC852_04945 [Acaryochloridaceae cyanobacterium RU_4_10]|nr:hypothetical protein [Acaryochloridaceae cyanobacterium RU_4_10]